VKGSLTSVSLSLLLLGGCSDDEGPGADTEPGAGTASPSGGTGPSSGGTGNGPGGGPASGDPSGGSSNGDPDTGTDATGSPGESTGQPGETDGDPQTLAEKYPGDVGIGSDPAVLFHDDFESGWGRWDAPEADTTYLSVVNNAGQANAGDAYLQSRVTRAHLDENQYISASPRFAFDQVDEVYWRFHVQFPHVAPKPHHWVRVAAGTDDWNSSGLANTVPGGDEGFWFDLDVNNDDLLNFYTYWHEMRSGRCNDGSATPGCDGDQGTTYYYGNVFQPNDQDSLPIGEWACIEIHAKANAAGEYDGALAFYVNDELIGDYRPGNPIGTWLRATFHEDGCDFSACTEPAPFEGFNFRTSDAVGFKGVFLDAYYQRDTYENKRQYLLDQGLMPSEEQTIFYDDIVVATTRIGCRQ
jgi:hypothetical protein